MRDFSEPLDTNTITKVIKTEIRGITFSSTIFLVIRLGILFTCLENFKSEWDERTQFSIVKDPFRSCDGTNNTGPLSPLYRLNLQLAQLISRY